MTMVDSSHSPATDITHTISAGSPGHTVTFLIGVIILTGDSGEAGTQPLGAFSMCWPQWFSASEWYGLMRETVICLLGKWEGERTDGNSGMGSSLF